MTADDPNLRRHYPTSWMPYNDEYQSCERTCAKLRIYGGELTPHEITEILGIMPTSCITRGESSVPNSLGRSVTHRLNGWFLSSEEHVKSLDLRRHLDWLINSISPHSNQLKILQDYPGVAVDVTCIWWSKSGHGGPTLWPLQMQPLAELNLECRFEISFYGDEE